MRTQILSIIVIAGLMVLAQGCRDGVPGDSFSRSTERDLQSAADRRPSAAGQAYASTREARIVGSQAGRPTKGPTRPRPTASPTRTPSPTALPPATPSSPLLTDGAQGRVYATTRQGSIAKLWLFDAETGDVVQVVDLEPTEQLFHVDVEQGELYLYSAGKVRVFDSDALEPLRSLALPTNWMLRELLRFDRRLEITDVDVPAFDPARRELVKIQEGQLKAFDSISGALSRSVPIDFPSFQGAMATLAYSMVDQSGQYLYLAFHSSLHVAKEPPRTDLMTIDMQRGTVVQSTTVPAILWTWFGWPDGMIASMSDHKQPTRQRFWSGGHERRQTIDSAIAVGAFDGRRHQLIGMTTASLPIIIDPGSMLPTEIGQAPDDFRPTAHDSALDRFYAWRADLDGLETHAAEDFYQAFERLEDPSP